MKPSIYQIDIATKGSLFVMPKPSSEWLKEDVVYYRNLGVNRIVSLLTLEESRELALVDEGSISRSVGIDFDQYPIVDRGLPDVHEFANLARSVARELRQGRSVAMHCRAGIGRAGMLACCTLQELGYSSSDAVKKVSDDRGVDVPDTEDQLKFIHSYKNY